MSTKQETYELLEFFFEDDIMLDRFMEYFDDFQLDVKYANYKRGTMKRMIKSGVHCLDIAEKTGITYKGVWVAKDRMIKKGLSKHIGEKDEEES